MKSKIFNAQEVQAILNGSKVQFREVIKPPRHEIIQDSIYKGQLETKGFQVYFENPRVRWLGENMPTGITAKCPYEVGQKIFCKESFDPMLYEASSENNEIGYKADIERKNHYVGDWKSAQHMKQEHSRLTLLIKEIRVERLSSISEEDAVKEGVFKSKDYWHSTLHPIKGTYQCWTSAKEAFGKIWNATHKKPEEKFEANPWVWKVEMEVVK